MSNIAYFLGTASGVLALSFAVYLEWISPKPCKAIYVYAYLLLGIGMILITTDYIFEPEMEIIAALGFASILLLEIGGFVYIKERVQKSTLISIDSRKNY